MFDKNLPKIEFILERIEFIENIIKRHKFVTKALLDEVEARPAILMHLSQIGEEINKIDKEILEKLELLEDAKGAYNVRNFIVHSYEGVNLALIERIIKEKFPILKEKFKSYINEKNSNK